MKIPFKVETVFNKVFKPQIVSIVEIYLNDKQIHKFYGKSLTANFLQHLWNRFSQGDANFQIGTYCDNLGRAGRSIANTLVTTTPTFQTNAAVGGVTSGIILGSGSNAPAPADYVLQTPIANGSAAGQLNYQQQTGVQGVQIAGANTSFIFQRLYTNNSGGNVNVRELAIYTLTGGQSFLIYRDVLPANDVIPTGGTYRVAITFQITT